MNKLHQIERLHQLFCTRRRPLTTTELCADLALKEHDLLNLLHQMQTCLGAPIVASENHGLQRDAPESKASESNQSETTFTYEPDHNFALPEFWLQASEFSQITKLLTLLDKPQPGLLSKDLEQLTPSVYRFLRHRNITPHQFERRVRYLSEEQPYCFPANYSVVCQGLLLRRQLSIHYQHSRAEQQTLTICPQLLIYRAGTWVLAAWCHLQHQLRCYDLTRICGVEILAERSREIASKNLDRFFANHFGYNQQQPLNLHLCFTGDSAFQVAQQCWHPEQTGHWQGESYHLQLPLVDQDLLLTRVLAHLPNVQVLEPVPFADRLQTLLRQALEAQARAKPPEQPAAPVVTEESTAEPRAVPATAKRQQA